MCESELAGLTETSNSAVRVVNDLFKVPEPLSSGETKKSG